jgi:hypothetical protein
MKGTFLMAHDIDSTSPEDLFAGIVARLMKEKHAALEKSVQLFNR